jgi:hypothetical protein
MANLRLFFDVLTNDDDGYDGFAFGPTASFVATFATDETLIDFDAVGKLLSLFTDGAAPELLKPGPGGAVAAKAQQFLQVRGIDA